MLSLPVGKRKRYFASMLFSITLLALILYNVDLHAVIVTFSFFPVWYFVVAFALQAIALFIVALRWWLLRPQESLMRILHVTFSSQYFVFVMPSSITFDVARVISTRADPGGIPRHILSVFVDKIVGFVCVLGMFTVTLITTNTQAVLVSQSRPVIPLLVLTMIVTFVLLMVLFTRDSSRLISIGFPGIAAVLRNRMHNCIPALNGLRSSISDIASNRIGLLLNLAASVLYQSLLVLRFFLVGYACGFSLSVGDAIVASTIVQIVTIIPLGVAGVGIKDLSYVAVMSSMGVHPSVALAASLSGYPITFAFGLLGWFLSRHQASIE